MSISFHQYCMCPQRVCPTAELKLFFVPFLKSFEHNCFIFFLSQSLIFYHILIFIQAKAFALEVIGSHDKWHVLETPATEISRATCVKLLVGI